MNKIINLLSLAFLLIIFSTSCKKNDNIEDKQPNPTDQLPPYTEVCASTFGCLINGEPFFIDETTPGISNFIDWTDVIIDGSKEFQLTASFREINSQNRIDLFINGINHTITEGKIYPINSHYIDRISSESRFSSRLIYNQTEKKEYHSDGIHYKGELHIKKLDLEKNIISGTFWFDVINTETGEVKKVTEGRFDLR